MKLEKIKQKIKDKIPELNKINEGCIIKNIRNKSISKILKIIPGDKEFKIDDNYIIFNVDYGSFGSYNFDSIKNQYEIIGSEPLITHLLDFLGSNYALNGSGDLLVFDYKTGDYVLCLNSENNHCRFNLINPCLKDQNLNVINFIYEIIYKNK